MEHYFYLVASSLIKICKSLEFLTHLFIDQVNDGEVKRAYITQEQIRYELNGAEEGAPSVLATTPIFDMDLPQRLESKGVEFAAAPPKKPNFFQLF